MDNVTQSWIAGNGYKIVKELYDIAQTEIDEWITKYGYIKEYHPVTVSQMPNREGAVWSEPYNYYLLRPGK